MCYKFEYCTVLFMVLCYCRYYTELAIPQKKTVWSRPSQDSKETWNIRLQWMVGCRTNVCWVSSEDKQCDTKIIILLFLLCCPSRPVDII